MPLNPEDLPEPENRFFKDTLRKIKGIRDFSIQDDLGNLQYTLNRKGLFVDAQVLDALIKARLRPNGDWNVNANKPLWGGELSFEGKDSDGKKNYYLQYQRQF